MIDNVKDIITQQKIIPEKKVQRKEEDIRSNDGTRIIEGEKEQIELKSASGETKKSTKESSLNHQDSAEIIVNQNQLNQVIQNRHSNSS